METIFSIPCSVRIRFCRAPSRRANSFAIAIRASFSSSRSRSVSRFSPSSSTTKSLRDASSRSSDSILSACLECLFLADPGVNPVTNAGVVCSSSSRDAVTADEPCSRSRNSSCDDSFCLPLFVPGCEAFLSAVRSDRGVRAVRSRQNERMVLWGVLAFTC